MSCSIRQAPGDEADCSHPGSKLKLNKQNVVFCHAGLISSNILVGLVAGIAFHFFTFHFFFAIHRFEFIDFFAKYVRTVTHEQFHRILSSQEKTYWERKKWEDSIGSFKCIHPFLQEQFLAKNCVVVESDLKDAPLWCFRLSFFRRWPPLRISSKAKCFFSSITFRFCGFCAYTW